MALKVAVEEMSSSDAAAFAQSLGSPSVAGMFRSVHGQWSGLAGQAQESADRCSTASRVWRNLPESAAGST